MMEYELNVAACEAPPGAEDETQEPAGSPEQFSQFLRTLFERHGVLQELRAHLRGHIVNLLWSLRTGEPLLCKELLSQRLEITFQALNILIAEYLLRQEFHYTLSVFASEIPLPNMMFKFAKTLIENAKEQEDSADVRFVEQDIWHVLNCLGVQCNSEHASNIVEMYQNNSQKPSLLLCILKCIPLYRRAEMPEDDELSVSSSKNNDQNTTETKRHSAGGRARCKHSAFCSPCRTDRDADNERYSRRKKHFMKDLSFNALDPGGTVDPDCLLKNVTVLEKGLIDEMFQQLKSVYEAEIKMVKSHHGEKMKHCLAGNQLQLQKILEEMEEEFRSRRDRLESDVQHRKQFLWEMARSLRGQQASLEQAMSKVTADGQRLTLKEKNLKEQLKRAEDMLKSNGEEMRAQLATELRILEEHIDVMKTERDKITQERSQLEKLKLDIPNQSDEAKVESDNQNRKHEELQRHYDILKDELLIVKKFIAASTLFEPKCLVHASTVTDMCGVDTNLTVLLNNTEDLGIKDATANLNADVTDLENGKLNGGASEVLLNDKESINNGGFAKATMNQLVNDLKKFKNANFSNDAVVQVNMEELQLQGARSRSSICLDAVTGEDPSDKILNGLLSQLQQDNAHLRTFADQQQDHIRDLINGQAKLQAELAAARLTVDNMARLSQVRPPVPVPMRAVDTRRHCGGNVASRQSGAGEELNSYPNSTPRILVPGDAIPFCGPFGRPRPNRDGEGRSYNRLNPWNTFRQTPAPLRLQNPTFRLGLFGARPVQQDATQLPAGPSRLAASDTRYPVHPQHARDLTGSHYAPRVEREHPAPLQVDAETREVSPTREMLSAAKKRLRKLEIEAEAVEKSYLDFRKRHSGDLSRAKLEMADFMQTQGLTEQAERVPQSVGITCDHPCNGKDPTVSSEGVIRDTYSEETLQSVHPFESYLEEYKKNQTIRRKFTDEVPSKEDVPKSTRNIAVTEIKTKENLVEKPLTEFRKLYQANNTPTTHIHRSLQKLRTKNKTTEKALSPILVLGSQSSEYLRHFKETLFPKRPTTSEKCTSKQIDILKDNSGNVNNIDEKDIKVKIDSSVVPETDDPTGGKVVNDIDKNDSINETTVEKNYDGIEDDIKKVTKESNVEIHFVESESTVPTKFSENANSIYAKPKSMDVSLPEGSVIARAGNKEELLQNINNSNKPILCVVVDGIGIEDSASKIESKDTTNQSILVLVESCMQQKEITIGKDGDKSLRNATQIIDSSFNNNHAPISNKNFNVTVIASENSPKDKIAKTANQDISKSKQIKNTYDEASSHKKCDVLTKNHVAESIIHNVHENFDKEYIVETTNTETLEDVMAALVDLGKTSKRDEAELNDDFSIDDNIYNVTESFESEHSAISIAKNSDDSFWS